MKCFVQSLYRCSAIKTRGPTRTVRSSLEERDTLLSSLSLELWQQDTQEQHEDTLTLSRKLQQTTRLNHQSHTHTQLLTLLDRTLWSSSGPFLCEHRTRVRNSGVMSVWDLQDTELLPTSLSLCLCFFFLFDFVSEEESLEWEKRVSTVEGKHLNQGCHRKSNEA